MVRVLVCGGRDYQDRGKVWSELDALAEISDDQMLPRVDFVVIHGGCPTGADQFADDWCVTSWVDPIIYPADWNAYGRSAGPRRNQQMIDEGRPDLVLAFPGGRGTADMVRRAVKAGIKVRHV